MDFVLAFRSVFRHRRRSALALAAIAAGVTALILARGFIDWNLWQYRETAIKSQLGHIRIHRAGYLESGLADPFAFLLPERAAEREAVAKEPHVRALAPRLSLAGLASHGDATLSFVAEGVDPTAEAELSQALLIAAGKNLSADDPRGIIVGEGLAAYLGVRVGDEIVLLVTTRTGGINAAEVRIRGLFSTVSKAYDDAALRLPLVTAQQLLRTSGTHVWVLLLDDTGQTEAVVAALRARLPQDKYEIVPWWDLADFYNKSAALLAKQAGVMKLMIGVLIILCISNTLMMSVMERTGEIGTCMALGISRNKILRQFLSEGVVLGVIGGAIGLALGTVLAKVITLIGIPLPPPPGMAREFPGGVRVSLELAADAFLLAVLTTLGASIYPSWKASRMVVVDALRHNR